MHIQILVFQRKGLFYFSYLFR